MLKMKKTCEPILGDKVRFIIDTGRGKAPDKKILGTLVGKYSNVYEVKTKQGVKIYQQDALTGANCSKRHRDSAKKSHIRLLKKQGVTATNQWY